VLNSAQERYSGEYHWYFGEYHRKIAGDAKIYLFECKDPDGWKIGGRKHWVQIPDNTEASPDQGQHQRVEMRPQKAPFEPRRQIRRREQ
jgi:hypothetical protein